MSSLQILLVDCYDSFAWNLVDALEQAGRQRGHDVQLTVVRSDLELVQAQLRRPWQGVVLSPGPLGPQEALASQLVVEQLAGTTPIFGVCLGMQVLAHVRGAQVVRATVPCHGKVSAIAHDGLDIFAQLPNPLAVMRYHSLQIDPATLPANLSLTAWLPQEQDPPLPMALRGPGLRGVQFHPESIGTPSGLHLLANVLDWMATSSPGSQ